MDDDGGWLPPACLWLLQIQHKGDAGRSGSQPEGQLGTDGEQGIPYLGVEAKGIGRGGTTAHQLLA